MESNSIYCFVHLVTDKKKEGGKEKSKSGFQETGRDAGEDPSRDEMMKSKKKWGHCGGD